MLLPAGRTNGFEVVRSNFNPRVETSRYFCYNRHTRHSAKQFLSNENTKALGRVFLQTADSKEVLLEASSVCVAGGVGIGSSLAPGKFRTEIGGKHRSSWRGLSRFRFTLARTTALLESVRRRCAVPVVHLSQAQYRVGFATRRALLVEVRHSGGDA